MRSCGGLEPDAGTMGAYTQHARQPGATEGSMQMAEPRSKSDTGGDAGTPRWVKVFGIIFFIVVLLFFIVLFTRGPHRGPGEQRPAGGPSLHPAPRGSHR